MIKLQSLAVIIYDDDDIKLKNNIDKVLILLFL